MESKGIKGNVHLRVWRKSGPHREQTTLQSPSLHNELHRARGGPVHTELTVRGMHNTETSPAGRQGEDRGSRAPDGPERTQGQESLGEATL